MKIVGAIALIVSSGAYGIHSGRKLEISLEQTRDFWNGLNALKQEIYLNASPIGIALERVSQLMSTDARLVFLECGKCLSKQNGTSLKDCLLSFINDEKLLIDDQSKNIISQWSAKAGNGDRKSELDSLECAIAQLDQHINNMEEQNVKKAKLYKNCGFLVGAFIVAVLI